jgi:hypothetical protein
VAKGQKPPGDSSPQDFAQVTPRDLHPTSDIRFVMVEVGKLTANVDRLIDDIKTQGRGLDEIKHKVSFIKGVMWATIIAVPVLVAVVGFFLSAKWDAVLIALRAVQK